MMVDGARSLNGVLLLAVSLVSMSVLSHDSHRDVIDGHSHTPQIRIDGDTDPHLVPFVERARYALRRMGYPMPPGQLSNFAEQHLQVCRQFLSNEIDYWDYANWYINWMDEEQAKEEVRYRKVVESLDAQDRARYEALSLDMSGIHFSEVDHQAMFYQRPDLQEPNSRFGCKRRIKIAENPDWQKTPPRLSQGADKSGMSSASGNGFFSSSRGGTNTTLEDVIRNEIRLMEDQEPSEEEVREIADRVRAAQKASRPQ